LKPSESGLNSLSRESGIIISRDFFNYYQSIGWISGSAAEKLLDMASLEKRYKGDSWTLSAEEQRISRLFIEKLTGQDIEDSLLNVPFQARQGLILKKKSR